MDVSYQIIISMVLSLVNIVTMMKCAFYFGQENARLKALQHQINDLKSRIEILEAEKRGKNA